MIVRFQGRIRHWQDEKGFGFVEPNGGGESAFVHIRSFRSGVRRPVDGDLIIYRTEKDDRGRLRTIEATFAESARTPARSASDAPPQTRLWSIAGAIHLTTVGAVSASGFWPIEVIAIVGALSVITFIAYALDKRAALANRRRIPESNLHFLAVLGGWPGAALAQHGLRHKSKKPAFRTAFVGTVVLNLVGTVWLYTDTGRRALAALLAG